MKPKSIISWMTKRIGKQNNPQHYFPGIVPNNDVSTKELLETLRHLKELYFDAAYDKHQEALMKQIIQTSDSINIKCRYVAIHTKPGKEVKL